MRDIKKRDGVDFHFTRRGFVELSAAAIVGWTAPLAAASDAVDPRLREAIAKLEYLTPLERGFVLDKGKAGVAGLPADKLREIGLTPETWSLDVVPDLDGKSIVERPLSRALGTALDWNGLMKLAETHAVRFLHVCTCTNGPDPYHMTLWEGVPLREIVWLTRPQTNVRRLYFQSYHPEDLAPFQASLPLGQVLETPPGQLPVILAYKMNGAVIPASHGGPVRMLVPGSHGSKQIKWVRRVALTNDYKANDSDAELNNDVESSLKTRARFINAPEVSPAQQPVVLTGMAQAGVSGLTRVQYLVHSQNHPWPQDDPYWTKVDWKDAIILPPPRNWGGGLPDGKLPVGTSLFDPVKGTPVAWPLRYTIVHWAALLEGLQAGVYDLCCRTIDGNGIAQPMPRPLPHTGFNEIHRVTLKVQA